MDRVQEDAFEQFVTAHGPRLIRAAFLLTGDRGHAEDLFQITLDRVAQRWTRLDGAPEAYARAVLSNLATDRWRRARARLREHPLDSCAEPSVAHDLADEVVNHQLVLAVLRRLPPRQRAVIVLRYFEDLTEQETATAMGITLGTVKSSTHRALVQLRTYLPGFDSAQTASLVRDER